jgi:PTH1 family peptidyl-tRNA hydrolase
MIVEAFTHKNGLSFKSASHLFGELAQGVVGDKKVFVLEPTTYMNESGLSVRRCVDYYKVPLEDLLVVSDDAALPVGMLRMRTKGSCGGHNGLNSIEAHVNSEHYARLRVGIGSPPDARLKDYVLSTFSQGEEAVVQEAILQAVQALELWLMAGIAAAMQAINAKKTES